MPKSPAVKSPAVKSPAVKSGSLAALALAAAAPVKGRGTSRLPTLKLGAAPTGATFKVVTNPCKRGAIHKLLTEYTGKKFTKQEWLDLGGTLCNAPSMPAGYFKWAYSTGVIAVSV